ncbi:MAG TPA: MarR family winged helix-turn-helix transcriptional regulator [Gaiellaceae bacterium]|jgi:DNA-binding MarR family transcriptional regulator|nr:MarR family winged helix-turn-helix transcriptional regulator [Gaiellaceae bacterium]
MAGEKKSSDFTQDGAVEFFGPPLIGALLRMPWEQVLQRMLTRLHEHGFDDLDTPHLNLVLYPGPQGARPSELAARRGMSKQAVNYLLGELERRGYLRRDADPDDRRSKRIALTPRGERAAYTIRDAVRDIERDWEKQLGRERFAQLRTLLLELNQLT